MPKPAAPAPSTSAENTGPSGTSMPPPMRPVARPTFTARTTGLMKMNDQPSFSSLNAWPKSMRRSPFLGRFSCLGSCSREMITAATRKHAAFDVEGDGLLVVSKVVERVELAERLRHRASSEKMAPASGNVP